MHEQMYGPVSTRPLIIKYDHAVDGAGAFWIMPFPDDVALWIKLNELRPFKAVVRFMAGPVAGDGVAVGQLKGARKEMVVVRTAERAQNFSGGGDVDNRFPVARYDSEGTTFAFLIQ
jgi:hypothetical protein